ncbi:hypothetical protein AWENTII_009653 [Aspergillus wentii]
MCARRFIYLSELLIRPWCIITSFGWCTPIMNITIWMPLRLLCLLPARSRIPSKSHGRLSVPHTTSSSRHQSIWPPTIRFVIAISSIHSMLWTFKVMLTDSQVFEVHARGIIGLERLMLEASGFDFRTRHPQKVLVKLARNYGLTLKSEVSNVSYRISLDLYRTFAPIKQTTSTMAFSCLELAGRLLDQRLEAVESGVDYGQWKTSREEIMETLFDLLELYTHQRGATSVGPHFPADRFLTVRIPLNQEAEAQRYPRHTQWTDQNKDERASNGSRGIKDFGMPDKGGLVHPLTPVSANGERPRVGERGRDGAVRFMLDPECADSEKSRVAEYFKVEMEEYEVEE